MLSLNKINRTIVIRYTLYQIPSLIIVILVVYTFNHWYHLNNAIIILIILLWIMKDILIFPFVWKAYSHKDRNKSSNILKKHGIAINDINPKGFIKVDGEIWQAESVEPHKRILKGQEIEVVEIEGMNLKVRKR